MCLRGMIELVTVAGVCAILSSCASPEDPARAALRDRLRQEAALTPDELDRLRVEVTKTMASSVFQVREAERTRALDGEQQAVVFGMLSEPAGMFDEGLHEDPDGTFRVLNAPAASPSSEIDAARRLWIDVDTLLPRRFEYTYGFSHPENYTYEIVTE